LQLDRNGEGRQVLKAVTPMRKRAGDVRDMDVLTGFASRLSCDRNRDGDQGGLVPVLEHLGVARFQAARKLHKSIAKRCSVASKRLKRCSRVITKNLNGSAFPDEWRANATADALELSNELAAWARLTPENLHPFRLKVKELRNVLKMAGEKSDLVERLGEVKDAIGEWHDWTVLSSIAKDSVKKSQGRSVVRQIDEIVKQKEQKALQLANQLRNRYFNGARNDGRQSGGKGILQPVLKSAANLAAQEHR
jgi:CHAD domain-containing protein